MIDLGPDLPLVLLELLPLPLPSPVALSRSLAGVGAKRCKSIIDPESGLAEVVNKNRCEGRCIACTRSTSGEVDIVSFESTMQS
jgi:hypothetical protein